MKKVIVVCLMGVMSLIGSVAHAESIGGIRPEMTPNQLIELYGSMENYPSRAWIKDGIIEFIQLLGDSQLDESGLNKNSHISSFIDAYGDNYDFTQGYYSDTYKWYLEDGNQILSVTVVYRNNETITSEVMLDLNLQKKREAEEAAYAARKNEEYPFLYEWEIESEKGGIEYDVVKLIRDSIKYDPKTNTAKASVFITRYKDKAHKVLSEIMINGNIYNQRWFELKIDFKDDAIYPIKFEYWIPMGPSIKSTKFNFKQLDTTEEVWHNLLTIVKSDLQK